MNGIWDPFNGTSIIELSEGDNLGANNGFSMVWVKWNAMKCPRG